MKNLGMFPKSQVDSDPGGGIEETSRELILDRSNCRKIQRVKLHPEPGIRNRAAKTRQVRSRSKHPVFRVRQPGRD